MILRLKSRFRREAVSCWIDDGSLKSSWPLGLRLKDYSIKKLKVPNSEIEIILYGCGYFRKMKTKIWTHSLAKSAS